MYHNNYSSIRFAKIKLLVAIVRVLITQYKEYLIKVIGYPIKYGIL